MKKIKSESLNDIKLDKKYSDELDWLFFYEKYSLIVPKEKSGLNNFKPFLGIFLIALQNMRNKKCDFETSIEIILINFNFVSYWREFTGLIGGYREHDAKFYIDFYKKLTNNFGVDTLVNEVLIKKIKIKEEYIPKVNISEILFQKYSATECIFK